MLWHESNLTTWCWVKSTSHRRTKPSMILLIWGTKRSPVHRKAEWTSSCGGLGGGRSGEFVFFEHWVSVWAVKSSGDGRWWRLYGMFHASELYTWNWSRWLIFYMFYHSFKKMKIKDLLWTKYIWVMKRGWECHPRLDASTCVKSDYSEEGLRAVSVQVDRWWQRVG